MNVIPAITVWQPWASLIVGGFKPYEFRGKSNPKAYRDKRVAIHAGARKPRRNEIADLITRLRSNEPWTTGLRAGALELLEAWHVSPERLPLGAVIGTAILGAAVRADTIMTELGAVENDSDRSQHFNWAWPMIDPKSITPICPCRGLQGWWFWNADLIEGTAQP